MFSFNSKAIIFLSCLATLAPLNIEADDSSVNEVIEIFNNVCVTYVDDHEAIFKIAEQRKWLPLSEESTKQLLNGIPGATWFVDRPGKKNRIIFKYRYTQSCGVRYDQIDPIAVSAQVRNIYDIKEIQPLGTSGDKGVHQYGLFKDGAMIGYVHETRNATPEKEVGTLDLMSREFVKKYMPSIFDTLMGSN